MNDKRSKTNRNEEPLSRETRERIGARPVPSPSAAARSAVLARAAEVARSEAGAAAGRLGAGRGARVIELRLWRRGVAAAAAVAALAGLAVIALRGDRPSPVSVAESGKPAIAERRGAEAPALLAGTGASGAGAGEALAGARPPASGREAAPVSIARLPEVTRRLEEARRLVERAREADGLLTGGSPLGMADRLDRARAASRRLQSRLASPFDTTYFRRAAPEEDTPSPVSYRAPETGHGRKGVA